MRNVRRMAIVPVLVVLSGFVGVAGAQAQPAVPPSQGSGVPQATQQLLDAIAALQAQLDAVQTSVIGSGTSLTTIVNGIQSDTADLKTAVASLTEAQQSTVKSTGMLLFKSGVMDCAVTNISSAPRNIKVQMINAFTGALIIDDAGGFPTPAGQSRAMGVFATAFKGGAYCRFEVLNGTAADIRGTLNIGAGGVDDTTIESAAAF